MSQPVVSPVSDFVPVEIDANHWPNLEPLYRALLDRTPASAAELETLLLDRSELDATAREAHTELYVQMTCHTDDEDAKRGYLAFVDDVMPQLKKVGFELDKMIVSSPHASDLDSARYEVMLRDLRSDVELFRDENVPLQTEDTRLGQRYSELCGAMNVTFRGEERTLPQMARHLEETDRPTREEAWRLVAERRLRDEDELSGIFDRMLEVRHKIARNAGFDNYRDYMFQAKHRFDYTPADCEAFHEAMEKICVPLQHALNRERAETLQIEPLRPWDLAVDPKGRAPLRPFQDTDELVEKTSRLFHRLGPALGELFDTLRDGTSLDLESRRGKAPGGYQENRDRQRRPFIFMNAAGMHGDLETMIHEAGHAFHSLLCRDEPLLHYRHPPIEFCEVASMGMELLAMPHLEEFYAPEEAARARRSHLEELPRMLPWIATIDAFQHWLYTNPGHDRAARRATWEGLMERFGAAVNWDGIEDVRAVRWQSQLHLFEVPFYYIEYGIAQLGALQLWLLARQDPDAAIEGYKRAMRIGGSRPLPELFTAAGLTFDFGPATVQQLMDAVGETLTGLPV